MRIATLRHADNLRDRRILDIALSDLGKKQASAISKKAIPYFQGQGPVLIISSHLKRGEQTRDILKEHFHAAGIETAGASASCIDAKTHDEYIAFVDMIMNLPKYAIMGGIKLPQAIIIVTHAHNIIGHMVEQLADALFHAKTPEALAEINFMLGTQREEPLDAETRDEFLRVTKSYVTNPENGYKAEYGEMRIFDLPIESWRDIGISCGQHIATAYPFQKTYLPENVVG